LPCRQLVAALATAVVLGLSVGPSLWAWVSDPWPPPWFARHGADAEATAEEFGTER